MIAPNVLVIGANRGIGLSILKAFVGRSWNVTGTIRPQSRSDSSMDELKQTGVKILEVDYLDETTIRQAASDYGDRPLEILANVGGLPPHPKPWHEQTTSDINEKFCVMAMGAFLAIKHSSQNLSWQQNLRLSTSHPLLDKSQKPTGNSFGTCLAYQAAKAALNQISVTMAREWEKEGRKSTIVCMEPGFLSNRFTGFEGEDDMETCTAGIMKMIDGITDRDSGAFLKWDGSRIPF